MDFRLNRILSVFFAVAVFFSVLPFTVSAAETSGSCGNNVFWSFDYSTGNLTLNGNGDMTDYASSSETPWYSYRSLLKTVTVTGGVMSVGDYAFDGYYSLTDVVMDDSVKIIGKYSFRSSALKKLNIPGGVTAIEACAFLGCAELTSVDISDGLKSIGAGTFSMCTGLVNIKIPCSVNSVGYGAFKDCNNLSNVDYSGTVAQWNLIDIAGDNTLLLNARIQYRVALNSGIVNENVYWALYDTGELVISGTGAMTDYSNSTAAPWYEFRSLIRKLTVSSGVTSIADYAFFDYDNLDIVLLSGTVVSIGYSAFGECDGMKNIVLPASVTAIGDYAFKECFALEEIIFRNSNKVTLGENPFYNSPGVMICCEEGSWLNYYADTNGMKICLLDEKGIPSFEIKNDMLLSYRGESSVAKVSTANKIGYGAFENNTVIKTVILSSSVHQVYANAFKGCTSLEKVIIPESVTSIGAGAFDGCNGVTVWCYAGSYAADYAESNNIAVEYITLDIEKDVVILGYNQTASLTASLNTPYADNVAVIWESTNPSIASVSQAGVVEGVKAGTAVIVARSSDGALSDYCVVKTVGIEAIATASIDHENGIISGLSANSVTLEGYVEVADPTCELNYDSLGTDSVVYVQRDGEIVDAYTVLIYGDVNGDGWYDGTDSIIVSCLANGLLSKENVSEAVCMAADCNHDGMIDAFDVALLEKAGMLLADIDQSELSDELAANEAYVEYIGLIDQTPDTEEESTLQTPSVPEEIPELNEPMNLINLIVSIIRSFFDMIISYLPIPIK